MADARFHARPTRRWPPNSPNFAPGSEPLEETGSGPQSPARIASSLARSTGDFFMNLLRLSTMA